MSADTMRDCELEDKAHNDIALGSCSTKLEAKECPDP